MVIKNNINNIKLISLHTIILLYKIKILITNVKSNTLFIIILKINGYKKLSC